MDTQVKKESDQGNVRCGSSPWQTLSWPHHQTWATLRLASIPGYPRPDAPRREDVRPAQLPLMAV